MLPGGLRRQPFRVALDMNCSALPCGARHALYFGKVPVKVAIRLTATAFCEIICGLLNN